MDIVVAPGLAAIVRLGALVIEQAANGSADARLDPPLSAAEAAVRARPPEESQAVRAMYRRIGLDLTTLVDVCNWCSLEFQLPYGLYDVSALQPPVVLRMGLESEGYPGIRKDLVNVANRLTLADQAGPFGNPTSDSARTMVTEATSSVLAVIFAPAETPKARVASVLEVTAHRLIQFAGGRQIHCAVI